ncbi:flippase [Enterococcus sp. BWT-B8]|uniref:flippase n=1 Tax=Enterococcus sp. BWT-B8 TaxID=2885157 RepID=UPI001E34C0C6|nr:flippase [Enterococcus sp. BWT-B8]MCB5951537.1 flippase [Enterococcus sp. BWT-B8]
MRNVSIKKNAVLNTLKTLLNVLFPLVTYPYIARILHVDNIGKFDFSKSIVSYFLLIAGFGISQYGVREGSGLRDDQQKLNKFCSEIFSLNVIISILSYVLLFALLLIGEFFDDYFSLILIFSINIMGTTLSIEWLYSLEEDFKYITLRSLFVQIVSLICMFIFVRKPEDYINYALITVLSFSGSSIFNFYHSKKYVKLRFTMHVNWRKHFPKLTVFFFNSLASMIYLSSDITLIGILKGDYFVGIYSTATKIYTIFKQLANSVLLVSVPRLSYYLINKNKEAYLKLSNKIFNLVILIVIPMSVGIIFLSNEIVLIIAGNGYERSVYSLSILSVASTFSLLSAFFVYGVLLPYKLERKVLLVTLISAIVSIILNFILIPFIAELGAAISTLIAELLTMIFAWKYSNQLVLQFKFKSSLLISLASGFLIAVVCTFVNIGVNHPLIKMVVSVSLSIICYIILLLITKNDYFLSFLPSKWNKKS